jgi:hypothetical protein
LFISQRVIAEEKPAILPVFSQYAKFGFVREAAQEFTLSLARHALPIIWMNKLATVDAQEFLKGKTDIIERRLVYIEKGAIRTQNPNLLRREIQDLSKLPFAFPDLLLRLLCRGDVHQGTHELLHIPGCVQNRMADCVGVFNSAIRKNDSVIHFVIRLFTGCSIFCLLHFGSILGMDTLQPIFPS